MPKYELTKKEVADIFQAIHVAIQKGGLPTGKRLVPIADKLGAPFEKTDRKEQIADDSSRLPGEK